MLPPNMIQKRAISPSQCLTAISVTKGTMTGPTSRTSSRLLGGDTQAEARAAIGADASSLVIGSYGVYRESGKLRADMGSGDREARRI